MRSIIVFKLNCFVLSCGSWDRCKTAKIECKLLRDLPSTTLQYSCWSRNELNQVCQIWFSISLGIFSQQTSQTCPLKAHVAYTSLLGDYCRLTWKHFAKKNVVQCTWSCLRRQWKGSLWTSVSCRNDQMTNLACSKKSIFALVSFKCDGVCQFVRDKTFKTQIDSIAC